MSSLVIGYGSPIRGDDAIGPMAADQLATLQEQGKLPVAVQIQARHILTAELVDDLQHADRVIFLDAAADTEPGEVHCRRIAPDAHAPSTMAHFHDPRELLAWCDALYGQAPDAWLITAGGERWDYGYNELSDSARGALSRMIELTLQRLDAVGDDAPRT